MNDPCLVSGASPTPTPPCQLSKYLLQGLEGWLRQCAPWAAYLRPGRVTRSPVKQPHKDVTLAMLSAWKGGQAVGRADVSDFRWAGLSQAQKLIQRAREDTGREEEETAQRGQKERAFFFGGECACWPFVKRQV